MKKKIKDMKVGEKFRDDCGMLCIRDREVHTFFGDGFDFFCIHADYPSFPETLFHGNTEYEMVEEEKPRDGEAKWVVVVPGSFSQRPDNTQAIPVVAEYCEIQAGVLAFRDKDDIILAYAPGEWKSVHKLEVE